MGFMSGLRKIGGAALGATRMVARNPLVRMVPGLGTAATIASAGLSAYGAFSAGRSLLSGGGAQPPTPPGFPMGGGVPPPVQGGFNLPVPFWRGAGGKFQMPWNDPQQMFGPPFAYDDSVLKIVTKAPPGFVKVKDPKGREYAMARFLAIKMNLYHPARKPLISVKESNAIRHAGHAIKKLQSAEKMAKKIANWKTPRRHETSGKKGRK